jgi:hypothetical protein
MQVALHIVMAAVLVNSFLALAGPPTTSAQEDWQTLQSWPGTGSGATDAFEASGSELRISWNVQGAAAALGSEAASVQIQVYQETTPTDTLVTTINAAGPGGQGTVTPPGAGRYYLQVTPITGTQVQWTLTVDQRPS